MFVEVIENLLGSKKLIIKLCVLVDHRDAVVKYFLCWNFTTNQSKQWYVSHFCLLLLVGLELYTLKWLSTFRAHILNIFQLHKTSLSADNIYLWELSMLKNIETVSFLEYAIFCEPIPLFTPAVVRSSTTFGLLSVCSYFGIFSYKKCFEIICY